MGWSSYPPEHKRSFKRAILAYALVGVFAAGWVFARADHADRIWNDRVPHASADIHTAYAGVKSVNNDWSVPAAPGEGQGYVSIIMTDAGISDTATARALDDLPSAVAVAFSPYAQKLDIWLKKAADAGRDSLILVPMEPTSYPKDDPGPEALLARLSEKDNGARLDWALSKAEGTVGAMNFMGSGFLNDDRNTRPVFDTLKAKNALFVEEPVTGGKAVAGDTAKAAGMSYLPGDMVIDANASELAIKKQLLDLETIARKRGYAVGIAQPYPITFSILKDWAEGLDRRGVKLVPLKAVLTTKVQHDKAAAEQQQQDQPPPESQLQQPQQK